MLKFLSVVITCAAYAVDGHKVEMLNYSFSEIKMRLKSNHGILR